MHTRAIVCRDLDGDKLPDVIVGNDKQASNTDKNYVYFNNGNFDFTESSQLGASTTYAIDVGDFNKDDIPDVAIGNYNDQSYIYINSGSGQFEKAAVLEKNYVRDIKVVDVDNNGFADVSTALDKNGLNIFINEVGKA